MKRFIDEHEVRGSRGNVITLSDLPPPGFKGRWTRFTKEIVILLVKAGKIHLSDLVDRYNIDSGEYLDWVSEFEKHGVAGLKATKRSK